MSRIPGSPLDIPEGRSGVFNVEHVRYPAGHEFDVVSTRQALLTGLAPKRLRVTEETLVHALKRDGSSGKLMSDLPIELRQMKEFARGARGRVLIGGLGLGLVAHLVAAKPSVESVTVVEVEPDVISLCADGLPPKVKVIQADLFDYLRRPSLRWAFDRAFFDIWYATSEATWVEFVAPLRRIVQNRFGKRVKCWAEDEMLGQMARSLSHQSSQPLSALGWSPAHYAFRAATIWKYPADENAASASVLSVEKVVALERRWQEDSLFRHFLGVFLTQVGSPQWETTFGVYWDEFEKKQKEAV